MTAKKIKAIIFDCDGTLVNSEVPTANLIMQILLSKGHKTTFEEILNLSRGEKLSVLSKKLQARFLGLDSEELIQIYNEEILRKLKTTLIPDPTIVNVIKKLQLPKCVASNGSRERTETALRATGLLGFFDGLIVSGYDINAWKPDPEIILHSARLLNTSPDECLLIDDSIDGLKAGLSAGVQVASFGMSDQKLGDLKKSVRQISDLAEVCRFV